MQYLDSVNDAGDCLVLVSETGRQTTRVTETYSILSPARAFSDCVMPALRQLRKGYCNRKGTQCESGNTRILKWSVFVRRLEVTSKCL